jgi:hypothetical protein
MTEQMSFSEAPSAVSIKALSPQGFDLILTVRDSDTAALMPRMLSALEWLSSKGFQPTNGYHSNGTNGSAPICQVHGKPMKASQYGGYYCPRKLDDGTYCKEKHD